MLRITLSVIFNTCILLLHFLITTIKYIYKNRHIVNIQFLSLNVIILNKLFYSHIRRKKKILRKFEIAYRFPPKKAKWNLRKLETKQKKKEKIGKAIQEKDSRDLSHFKTLFFIFLFFHFHWLTVPIRNCYSLDNATRFHFSHEENTELSSDERFCKEYKLSFNGTHVLHLRTCASV